MDDFEPAGDNIIENEPDEGPWPVGHPCDDLAFVLPCEWMGLGDSNGVEIVASVVAGSLVVGFIAFDFDPGESFCGIDEEFDFVVVR